MIQRLLPHDVFLKSGIVVVLMFCSIACGGQTGWKSLLRGSNRSIVDFPKRDFLSMKVVPTTQRKQEIQEDRTSRRLDTMQYVITTYAGGGSGGGDGGAATSAQLSSSTEGVSVDISGNVYIANVDDQKIRKISSAGIITTLAGTGKGGYSGDNGAASLAQLSTPDDVFADSNGNIYIVDDANHRIRKVNNAGIITTIAGTGKPGDSGDGGAATSAQLSNPTGVCADSNGNVYIADNGNNKIRKVNNAGIITTYAGTGYFVSYGGGRAATLAAFDYPNGVSVDTSGNIYIADTGNNLIRIVNNAGIITTFAGTGPYIDFRGDGGAATSAYLDQPRLAAVDISGNVYIADTGNHRIRKVDIAGIITTFAGTGTSGSSGDGGAATLAQLVRPQGVAVDISGNVYIADYNKIRKVILSCAAGTYIATAGSSVCQQCSIGSYGITVGATSCVSCPLGTITVNTGSTACTACPSGYWSGGGSCTACPAGAYNPLVGSSSSSACLQCSGGTFSTGASPSCQSCPAGTFNPNMGSTSVNACLSCSAGYYSPAGSSACLKCGVGMYSSIGSSSCQSCSDGTYTASSGSSGCQSCPTGYTGGIGATSCPSLTGGYIAMVVILVIFGCVFFILVCLCMISAVERKKRLIKEQQEAAEQAIELKKQEVERIRMEREAAAKKAAEDERLRQEAAVMEAARVERERIEAARKAAEEAALLQREKECAALTPQLFHEFNALEIEYPKAIEYHKKTVKAKTALLAYEKNRINKMRKNGEKDKIDLLEQAWKISFERHELHYTPKDESGVNSLHNKLLDLKCRLRAREKEQRNNIKSIDAMDFAEICQNYLKRIQKLVGSRADASDLKIINWSDLSPIEGPSLLGAGQFGTVYRVLMSVESVAVKVVHSLECEDTGLNYDDELLRSLQEAEMVMDICHSGGIGTDEHVTKVYGFVKGSLTGEMEVSLELPAGDAFGIVMRLEAGGTLKERLHGLQNVPPMPLLIKEKLRFVQQIARGLYELHRIGVVHADIKPANVLLSSKNPPDCRLADFGQSFVREITLGQSSLQYTQTHAAARGTPVYSAPEILQFDDDGDEGVAGKASRSTDIYSFGIMMHEILSMQEPFKSLSGGKLRKQICDENHRPPLDQLPRDTPPDVRALMENCWDGNRSRRPTAAECLSTLTHNLSVIESSQFDIFFSYSHTKKPFVVHLFDVMTKLGFRVWSDQNNMGHNMSASMKKGIENSTVTMCFVDQNYQQSKNCQDELQHARNVVKKPVVIVIVEGNFWTWSTDAFKELCDVKTKMFGDLSEMACQAWDDPDKVDGLLGALTASTSLQSILMILKDLDCRPSIAPIMALGGSSKPTFTPVSGPNNKSKTSKVLPVGEYVDDEQPYAVHPSLTIDIVKDPVGALTPVLFQEYDELSKLYPLIQQYEPLTECAKEAFSSGQMDIMERIGAARDALQYSPESRFTIATGQSQLKQLEIDLQLRRKYLLKELHSPQSIESCVACSLYLDRVQGLLNSKAVDVTMLLRTNVGIVRKKNYYDIYSSALTTQLQEERTYLLKHYINTLQYETLTEAARKAYDAGQWNFDDLRKIGAQRAALNYEPPTGFTVASGHARLMSLRIKLEEKQQIHLNTLQRSKNIDYVLACNECLDEVKKLLDLGMVSRTAPPQVSSDAITSIGFKNPIAALTQVLQTEFQDLKEHCSKTILDETLARQQLVAQNNDKKEEAKEIFDKRKALNYSPPDGFTVNSVHDRLLVLQDKVSQRRQLLRDNLLAPENIDYIVACTNCLQQLEVLVKECSIALPKLNTVIQEKTKELKTISWMDLTVDNPDCVLGTGSFGRVFQLSWQHSDDKVAVAVKVMSETFAKFRKRNYAKALEMAKQEAETIHEISVRGGDAMSTHVIQVYGFVQGPLPPTLSSALKGGRAGEEAYGIVMRLEAGGSLGQLLHPGPGMPSIPITMKEKIRIIALAARGLAELHRIGVVHGDLKSENMLLSNKNPPDVRIADFGLSKIREQLAGPDTSTTATAQKTTTVAGTKLYNAPEMLPINADGEGKVARASRSTDMFAFGIIMHEVFSGLVPYEGQTEINDRNFETKISQGIRPLLGQLSIYTPPAIQALMEKCWDGDRIKRPTAAECLATLQHEWSVSESNKFDIFFSHPWAKKPFLSNLFIFLHSRGYRVWYDKNNMGYDLVESMIVGIKDSHLTIACVDSLYQTRPNCLFELENVVKWNKPVITVLTESNAASWVKDTVTLVDGTTRKGLRDLHNQSVRAGTCLDLGALAALPEWGEDGGGNTTEDMLRQLEAAAEPLLQMLEQLGCKPSMRTVL